jgi:tetratricopeptide (TPR) repeat protein
MDQSSENWESVMARRALGSEISATALQMGAVASTARVAAGAEGEAASKDALAKLDAAVAELRALAVQPMLQQAITCLNAGDYKTGESWALKALEKDERCGLAWYLLAFAREKAGDFISSVKCYESALALLPDHADVANDLGRLAYRMGMVEQAEKLFRHFLARYPDHLEGSNNLASALRELGRGDEAIEILRAAIIAHPESGMLWNALGAVVSENGDFENAQIFFQEAITQDPGFAKARYNLGNARLSLGDAETALAHCEAALAMQVGEDERQMMRLARSTTLIALGRIKEGWDEYEARLHPQFAGVTHFQIQRPQWKPGDRLQGRTMLVIGEQGLGDEVLFANLLEDVRRDLGPDGRLLVAVEPRLVGLFQRSFPDAEVGAHATYSIGGRTVRLMPAFEDRHAEIDLWSPLGSLLRAYRPEVAAFPDRPRFLTADPERVAHWRDALQSAPPGPKVGLLWKSAVSANARKRYFSPFENWAPVLAVPGVSFVNLQYGDCAAEIEAAREHLGVEIWTPPGIDLKQDLDDVAALCCAMDLVIGFSNATLNLAGACGAPTWLITNPGAWPRLGCDRTYPWYPQAKAYPTPSLNDWGPVMGEIADDLARFAGA